MEENEGRKVYLFAVAGSKHAARADSFECYSDVAKLGRRVIRHYSDCRKEALVLHKRGDRTNNYSLKAISSSNESIKGFIVRMHSYRVYETVVDSESKARKIKGSFIWKMIEEHEELKSDITKVLLRQ